jgi:hypothetical protein
MPQGRVEGQERNNRAINLRFVVPLEVEIRLSVKGGTSD